MERYIRDPHVLSRMQSGPLGLLLNDLAQQLSTEGYKPDTARYHLRLAAAFSSWLGSKRVRVAEIKPEHAESFLRQRAQKIRRGDSAILCRVFGILQQGRILPKQPMAVNVTPVDQVTEEFTCYLQQERGLAPSTIVCYRAFAHEFLVDRFSDGPVNCLSLSAEDVIGFVQRQAKILHRKRSRLLTTALRSFFQFTRYQGYTRLDLAAGVPTVPCWSMADIPKGLPLAHVELVLSSCDRDTVGGRRDYAILLLLARLGLRGGEIVSLTLSDIDWENGCVIVRGKGRRYDKLPLPADVGEALADYLRDGRPQHNSRALFLKEIAPVDRFRDQQAIGSVVRRALARAGIDAPRKGSHQFRHALATTMLGQGASLPEIGEILRHRLPSTTAIYAKVDIAALRELALPWPGGAQ